MSSSSNTITKPNKSTNNFLDWITQYDSLVIFGMGFVAIMATIIITGLFHSGDSVRKNILFNAICGLAMAAGFVWLIYKFMGTKITIFGKSIDFGMLVYVCIILFIVFIFGN